MTRFLQKNYLLLAGLVALVVLALNYHATAMQGLLQHYEDFARIISAGFDPSAALFHQPTFPIWGYGWIFLLVHSKLVILVLQNALALGAIGFFVRTISASKMLPAGTGSVFRLLVIVSVPFFALHSVLWPYSIAASLIAISLALLIREADRTPPGYLGWVLSGLSFGLMLNFRSDFILFPLVVPLLVAMMLRSKAVFGRSLIWVGCVYLMLVPWGLYTRHAIGHFVLTSTNSGAVLFLGLGQLPGNKWGITPSDGDPSMHATVRNAVGPRVSAFSYGGSRVLKAAMVERVRAEPAEYMRKVAHGMRLTVTQGFYPGSFFEYRKCLPDCYPGYKARLRSLSGGQGGPGEISAWRALVQGAAVVYSRALLISCFLALPFAIVWGWRKRSLFLAVAVAGVIYQAGITTFTYHLPGYTSNVYLFHLLILSSVLGRLFDARTRELRDFNDPAIK